MRLIVNWRYYLPQSLAARYHKQGRTIQQINRMLAAVGAIHRVDDKGNFYHHRAGIG
jgi:hypothetical protein